MSEGGQGASRPHQRRRPAGPPRRSAQRPSERSRRADPARQAAFDTLRAVDADDAYANLVLPGLLRARRISGRDAAFATELAYGALRMRGLYDAVLAAYAAHYNTRRPHRALQLRPPRPHSPVSEPVLGRIRRRPVLGGLIYEYEPAA